MPYLEESTQSDNTGTSSNTSTEDCVFTSHSNDTQLESQILLTQFLDGVLGVPKENHLKDMAKSILLEQ